jgi:hypothetical protein
MKWIKKLIPVYIEIRSLYWVEHGKKMDEALGDIFDAIDNDNYDFALKSIIKFENEFSQGGVPEWIGVKYSEIYRAISMINFLK